GHQQLVHIGSVPARLRPWRQEPLPLRTAEARYLYDELADDIDGPIDEHDVVEYLDDHHDVADPEHECSVQARLGLRRQEPLPLGPTGTHYRPQRRKRPLTHRALAGCANGRN